MKFLTEQEIVRTYIETGAMIGPMEGAISYARGIEEKVRSPLMQRLQHAEKDARDAERWRMHMELLHQESSERGVRGYLERIDTMIKEGKCQTAPST